MQPWPNAYDFQTLLNHFFELHPLTGPYRQKLSALVDTHARTILSHPDVRYMPAFKVLDLLAEMVSRAASIDDAPQLREIEATKMLEAEFAPTAPLLRSFVLEAALERARYEPLMVHGDFSDAASHRASLLTKRWLAMREVHRRAHMLPDEWLQTVDEAIAQVMKSKIFSEYRVGPLLQMFAEMLQYARQLYANKGVPAALTATIGEGSPLWKRYQLKAKRFKETDDAQPFDAIPTASLNFPKHLQ